MLNLDEIKESMVNQMDEIYNSGYETALRDVIKACNKLLTKVTKNDDETKNEFPDKINIGGTPAVLLDNKERGLKTEEDSKDEVDLSPEDIEDIKLLLDGEPNKKISNRIYKEYKDAIDFVEKVDEEPEEDLEDDTDTDGNEHNEDLIYTVPEDMSEEEFNRKYKITPVDVGEMYTSDIGANEGVTINEDASITNEDTDNSTDTKIENNNVKKFKFPDEIDKMINTKDPIVNEVTEKVIEDSKDDSDFVEKVNEEFEEDFEDEDDNFLNDIDDIIEEYNTNDKKSDTLNRERRVNPNDINRNRLNNIREKMSRTDSKFVSTGDPANNDIPDYHDQLNKDVIDIINNINKKIDDSYASKKKPIIPMEPNQRTNAETMSRKKPIPRHPSPSYDDDIEDLMDEIYKDIEDSMSTPKKYVYDADGNIVGNWDDFNFDNAEY